MNPSRTRKKRNTSEQPERNWPLDASIAGLAGVVLYLSVTQLRFDDPRLLYNAWTYAIGVPLTALLLALFSHAFLSRYVHRSIQIGLLFSLLVHLILLILAVNVIIFSRYFPEAFTGLLPEKPIVSKSVPEYVFQTKQQTSKTPDWAKPIETETSSRVVTEQPKQPTSLDKAETQLETPRRRESEQRPLEKFLTERKQPSKSSPMPVDSPMKMARQSLESRTSPFQTSKPDAPDLPEPTIETTPQPERDVPTPERPSQRSTADIAQPSARQPEQNPLNRPSLEGARSREADLPVVGAAGRSNARRQRETTRVQPAGSAPAPQSIAVARLSESATRVLAPVDIPLNRQAGSRGANLSMLANPNPGLAGSQVTTPAGLRFNDRLQAPSGVPEVTAGQATRAPGRTARLNLGAGMTPLGEVEFQTASNGPVSEASEESNAMDPLEDRLPFQSARSVPNETISSRLPPNARPSLNAPMEDGPSGIAEETSPRPELGIVTSEEVPKIVGISRNRTSRPKRNVGGPIAPFGAKIASVESFNRRVLRTGGGSAAPSAGLVAPATEEAIERGLSYLASVQNQDGGWSLQGHGSEVILLSDTAATGLCLLAFQGAGYTHKQHQYTDTVARGLKFLTNRQRSNGDLYQPENAISNRNVAFYSHGIASLALCEAYGMTQDPALKTAAQNSLDYIATTQHQQRGGWRYTPQISSDTSVTGWMMMALKSGQLSGLKVPEETYEGINRWLSLAQSPDRPDRYRYNPFAPDTPSQRHGRLSTPTMTAVGMLMRMYSGWRRDTEEMQSAADYLLQFPPQMGTTTFPQRDAYYWYYATQVMFHMGGRYWEQWNQYLNPILLDSQVDRGPASGSWDPELPVKDRWGAHAGRIYVTTMNVLNLEVFYRHLPIYEETAQ